MTYLRSTVFETSLLRWQQITLQDADSLWSAEYRPDAPRLILPTTRCFECQLGDVRFVCDPSVAIWLTRDSPYRMKRRWSPQRSLLLAFNADLGPAQRIGKKGSRR